MTGKSQGDFPWLMKSFVKTFLTNPTCIAIIRKYEKIGDIMLLNLSKILSTPSAKEDFSISLELTSVRFMGNEYPVKDKQDVIIHAENIGKNKVDVKGSTILTLNLICDRCLEDVPWKYKIEFEKEYDRSDANDEWNQESFIEGNNLDVDGLIYEELIQKIPMKVLCSEECKGIDRY